MHESCTVEYEFLNMILKVGGVGCVATRCGGKISTFKSESARIDIKEIRFFIIPLYYNFNNYYFMQTLMKEPTEPTR